MFRAGFVAVVGRPNVGKSTLVNGLLGQKVAAVSPRPQTTRRQQLGILTLPEAQVVLVDTPGLHKPVHRLGEYMNQVAASALADADLVLWLVDGSEPPGLEDRLIAERLQGMHSLPPVMMALNKVDVIPADLLPQREADYLLLFPTAELRRISALKGTGQAELSQAIIAQLPEGQPFYEEEQITDLYEREIAADLIRAAALIHLRDEVPHSTAVRIDEYRDLEDDRASIAATLFVERESQKGIVIGKGGEMLKKIGTHARQQIEEMTGRSIFLELRVKVSKDWRDDPNLLKQMGFHINKEER